MALWGQLDVDQAHKSYAIVGLFSTIFCLVSLFMKERLFIGEAVVSTFIGSIFGPNVLNLVNPNHWAIDNLYVTKEISRITLIIQIFAISVEVPRKYMKINYASVLILLAFTMILGWLITGAFAYVIFPNFSFIDGLTITAAITATDPVLAAAIVGKGKFGERIPAYLRHLISVESGANDGLAFPFVLLAVNILVKTGHSGSIIKEFFLIAILYECVFGIILGVIIGFLGRKATQFCESRKYIDKESFLILYILLSLVCTGFGTILGVDDLLVSFAAGSAFAWNGWVSQKIEGQYLSNSIDLLLNVGYFLYFGSIIPWEDFNNSAIGLDIWRLILFGVVIIFLRRIPAVLLAKPFVPAITTWKEAVFVGHFGPIGVGGIFCSIITKDFILHYSGIESLEDIDESSPYYTVVRCIWPIVSFLVVTSIIIHGFSVTAIVLYSKIGLGQVLKRDETGLNNQNTLDSTAELEDINLEITSSKKEHEDDDLHDKHLKHLHSRRVLLGKNTTEDVKFYKIGSEVIVEDLNENFIKKYKIIKGDEETFEKLVCVASSEFASRYDDEVLQKCLKKFIVKC